jgi:predicted nucleotidyltransferase
MRLDHVEKAALEKAIANVDGEVYLFGSRVDDKKKGGDIDILIFSAENPFRLSQEVSVEFFMECEEKIDVIVMNPKKLTKEQQAFLKVIKMERIG